MASRDGVWSQDLAVLVGVGIPGFPVGSRDPELEMRNKSSKINNFFLLNYISIVYIIRVFQRYCDPLRRKQIQIQKLLKK